MPNPLAQNAAPFGFFVLTFLLSIPFYVLNALAHLNILGVPELGGLYVTLFTVTPIVSASILTFRSCGSRGLRKLVGRIFDFRRIASSRWYVAILLLAPFILLLTVAEMALFGAALPSALVPLVAMPAVLVLFFLMAAGEEVGWMGYAFEPMQARSGALRAALVLGVIWALWHLPFFVFLMPDPVTHGAQLVTLIGTRVLIVWVFNNTGQSVFATILFHAVDNTALVVLPEITAHSRLGAVLLCSHVLIVAAIVTWLWGRQTLARYRLGNSE